MLGRRAAASVLWPEATRLVPGGRLLPANSLNHIRKSCRREGLFSFSWILVRRKELRFRLRSWQVKPGQSSKEVRFCLSHFASRLTSSKRIGPRAAPKSSCGDARFASAIRSSAMDTAANRRTMNTTIGSGSGAVAVPVARKPSPFSRCFLSPTRTTVCWHAVRPCGGALWSTAPGKKQRLRSKTLTACLIPPHFAAGPTAWTAPNRHFPFSIKRSPP